MPKLSWRSRPAVLVFAVLQSCGASAEPTDSGPWMRHTIDDSSTGADGVKLADVNADGHVDVATGWEEGGVTRIYLNPGPALAKRKWPAVTVGETPNVEDAVLVDLDGDGAWDVVSCCEGKTQCVYVHWGPKQPEHYLRRDKWQQVVLGTSKNMTRWMYAMPARINADRRTDLFAGSKGPNGRVGWWEAPANPRDAAAWSYHHLTDAGWIMSLEPLDVDHDEDIDVVLSDRYSGDSGVYWLENPGPNRAGETWSKHLIGMQDLNNVMFLHVTVGQDDRPHEIVATVKPNRCVFYHPRDNPHQPWQLRHSVSYPRSRFGTIKAAVPADLDQDGTTDLVISCEGARGSKSGVFIILDARGAAAKIVDISGPTGTKYDRIELIDLDDDGDLDVLTCEEAAKLGVFWYENPLKHSATP